HLGKTNGPIHEADTRDALELASSALTMLPAQTGTLSYPATAGNGFDVRDFPNNFKVHVGTYYQAARNAANRKPNALGVKLRLAATESRPGTSRPADRCQLQRLVGLPAH